MLMSRSGTQPRLPVCVRVFLRKSLRCSVTVPRQLLLDEEVRLFSGAVAESRPTQHPGGVESLSCLFRL